MCRLSINKSPAEIQRSIKEDIYLKQLLDKKKKIMSKAIYSYTLDIETGEMEIKFSEPCQKLLDGLDKMIEERMQELKQP